MAPAQGAPLASPCSFGAVVGGGGRNPCGQLKQLLSPEEGRAGSWEPVGLAGRGLQQSGPAALALAFRGGWGGPLVAVVREGGHELRLTGCGERPSAPGRGSEPHPMFVTGPRATLHPSAPMLPPADGVYGLCPADTCSGSAPHLDRSGPGAHLPSRAGSGRSSQRLSQQPALDGRSLASSSAG